MSNNSQPNSAELEQARLGYAVLGGLIETPRGPDERVRVAGRTSTKLSLEAFDGASWKPVAAGTFATLYVNGKPYNVTTNSRGNADIDKAISNAEIEPLMVRLDSDVITIPRVAPPTPGTPGPSTKTAGG